MSRYRYFFILNVLLLIIGSMLVTGGCSPKIQLPLTEDQTKVPPPTVTRSPSPTVTPTPFPPSPTPVPSAAIVNGEMISLADYQAELSRYQAARQQAGLDPEDNAGKTVIDDLIDQVLLAQGAQQAGFVVEDTQIDAHLADLVSTMNGEQALNDWMAENGYTQETFRAALGRSIASAWMRDKIIGEVPDTAEQVHARQILLRTAEEADQVHAELESGKEFAQLADTYDPIAGGELGWFPRGYLDQPAVEAAAFALQPGEFSPVVETPLGYHIIQVIDREADRPLEPDAKLVLQTKALQEWLDTRRETSEINITLP